LNFSVGSLLLLLPAYTKILPKCEDKDMNCYVWVAENSTRCEDDEIVNKDCKKACGICEGMPSVEESGFFDVFNCFLKFYNVALVFL
jgi:hypothetical protein